MAAYKVGIKLWNLYDLNWAHHVINYQTEGESMIARAMSFNEVCLVYGFSENPLKDAMKGTLYTRHNSFTDDEELPEDLAYYSACDVEPLLDLYEVTNSLIEPDFRYLFEHYCELEIFRAIDPDFLQNRKKNRHRVQAADIFLKNLDPKVTVSH